MKVEKTREILIYLEQIVPVIDKIASGFEDTEELAFALLLFFKEEKILDKLAYIRKEITLDLYSMLPELSEDDCDKFLENIDFWKPPYNKTKQELIYTLKAKKQQKTEQI